MHGDFNTSIRSYGGSSTHVEVEVNYTVDSMPAALAFIARVDTVREGKNVPPIPQQEPFSYPHSSDRRCDEIIRLAVLGASNGGTQKLHAIMLHRYLTKVGLKESKDTVEAWIAEEWPSVTAELKARFGSAFTGYRRSES